MRRQLGRKLRQLRIAARKDVLDVTEAGLGSKAKISRIETGKGPVRMADIRGLCWLYQADAETTEALAALAPGTQQEDWWEGTGVVPDWLTLYAGLAGSARRIRCFEPELVHGLVQTPEYARAVIGMNSRIASDLVEQRVRFRMERQHTAAEVTVILGEGALRLVVGSREIMAAQLAHLRRVPAAVRILPFDAGLSPRRVPFALLEFPGHDDPPVVYVEGAGVARYLERPADWAEYEYVWKILTERSISIEEWPE